MKPRTLQEFLASDEWDEDRMADSARELVVRDHTDPQAIGVIDESGHPKKGNQTAGVSRQYCGNTGKIDNCVMTVHLTYTTFDGQFRTMLDSSLYLPKCWDEDRQRCREAKIPDDVVYRPKYDIALEQLDLRGPTACILPGSRRTSGTRRSRPSSTGWNKGACDLCWKSRRISGPGCTTRRTDARACRQNKWRTCVATRGR